MRAITALIVTVLLAGCDQGAAPYTLYRNSGVSVSIDKPVRIHVATFNADESNPNFNRSNCAMSSRLYNANINALTPLSSANSVQRVGFWCEVGEFKRDGDVPAAFSAAFPTDTE